MDVYKKQDGKTLVLLIVIAALIIGGGYYFYRNGFNRLASKQEDTQQGAPNTSVQPGSIAKDTSNWKVYENTYWHYQMKLPIEFGPLNGQTDAESFTPSFIDTPDYTYKLVDAITGKYRKIDVYVNDTKQGGTVEGWRSIYTKVADVKDINIDGKKAIVVTFPAQKLENNYWHTVMVFIDKGHQIVSNKSHHAYRELPESTYRIEIQFRNQPVDGEFVNVLLSTLKFN